MTERTGLSSLTTKNDDKMSEFEFQSVNKMIEKSFRDNWDRLALSNYQGVSLCYRDVARGTPTLRFSENQGR